MEPFAWRIGFVGSGTWFLAQSPLDLNDDFVKLVEDRFLIFLKFFLRFDLNKALQMRPEVNEEL